jgi:hypothetical protein
MIEGREVSTYSAAAHIPIEMDRHSIPLKSVLMSLAVAPLHLHFSNW